MSFSAFCSCSVIFFSLKLLYFSAENTIFAALNLIDMKSKVLERTPLVRAVICLMAGIVIGDSLQITIPLLPVFAGGVLVALLLWKYEHLQTIAIGICFVVLGSLLIQRQQPERVMTAEISQQQMSRIDRSKTFFLRQRVKLLERLQREGLEGDVYAVVAAMALGDKSALTKDLKNVYSLTGASHVLALSGLHLGIIYTLISFLIVGRRWQMVSQLICILSIWTFVFLVGMSVSVVRSAIMLTIYALLSLGHRDKMSVNTLAFAALAMLVVSPRSLFDIGFQMSFMAVLSILLWMPVFMGVFSERFLMEHHWVKWGWGMVAVSVAAQTGVAPLVAYYFGRFSSYFLLTNFIVIPAATLILYLSLVVLLIPRLAYLLIYIVTKLNAVLSYIATIPGASIDGLHPTLLQVSMVYVIILAVYLLLTYIPANGGYR
jgi:competence protein ComEC